MRVHGLAGSILTRPHIFASNHVSWFDVAALASALPRSDIEDGMIGEASTAAKRRAQSPLPPYVCRDCTVAGTAIGGFMDSHARVLGMTMQ